MSKKNNKQHNEIISYEIESNRRKNIEQTESIEEGDDATKYGEFISSYFAWLTPDKQRKRAEEIDKMTKKE